MLEFSPPDDKRRRNSSEPARKTAIHSVGRSLVVPSKSTSYRSTSFRDREVVPFADDSCPGLPPPCPRRTAAQWMEHYVDEVSAKDTPHKPNHWTTHGCGLGRYGHTPVLDNSAESVRHRPFVTLQSADLRARFLDWPECAHATGRAPPKGGFKSWTESRREW